MDNISPYLRRPLRSLEEYRNDLLCELGRVPVSAGRSAELARLILMADAEIEARKPR